MIVDRPIVDPHSCANSKQIKILHYSFDFVPDFNKSILKASVGIKFHILEKTQVLNLDIRDLLIKTVTVDGLETKYCIKSKTNIGWDLEIEIFDGLALDQDHLCVVEYETTSDGAALQWLTPEQTVGGKHPYLFSQCQAIHARSMFPCFDTPGVKATYSGKVSVPTPLVAVMSAISTSQIEKDGIVTYSFEQNIPIPTYLVALAVGNLEKRQIGPRSSIWTEPEMIEKGAFEFSDTEDFIQKAESFLPKYVWGTYDILLLPKSFPYGGMENTNLTFVTPTLLAGDRSLADVVAHEISHSWAGNLVTNSTWESFWLNEGFVIHSRLILDGLH